MTAPRNGYTVAYFVSWAVALAPVGVGAAVCLGADDTTYWFGVIGGVAVGLGIARVSRTAAQLHRVLRLVGPTLAVGGVVGAVLLYSQSTVERRTGDYLGGLVEFLYAVVGLSVALTGGALWVAGMSGPRLVPAA